MDFASQYHTLKQNSAVLGIPERIKILKSLRKWLLDHKTEVQEALYNDFRKPKLEAELSEVFVALSELNHTIKNLPSWAKSYRVSAPLAMASTVPKVVFEPKGLCLIISPWNYPFLLAINPLIVAIAAGNRVVLKPSEMTPHTADLLETMVSQVFDNQHVQVVKGDAQVAGMLLNEYKWDHIFFTGSPTVGKIVMMAAAKYLTSVTLELGGKSPAIVDETADIRQSAERIAWGKFLNNGQTCIAPDYVLVHYSKFDELTNALRAQIHTMYGSDPAKSEDYARIVNGKHFERLKVLYDDALQNGARCDFGGQFTAEDRFISPTILVDTNDQMKIASEEIFGPLLPILPYATTEQLIEHFKDKEKPLSFYIFSDSNQNIREFSDLISAGSLVINECLINFGYVGMPFGGVNNSGIGKSGGKYGFLEFSNQKSVIRQYLPTLKMLYPPYKPLKQKIMDFLLKIA